MRKIAIATTMTLMCSTAFAQGTGHGLMRLGAAEVGQALPPVFVWWRGFAAQYIGSLCLHASGTEAEERRELPGVPAPTSAELSSLVLTAPMMPGAEYLTQDALLALWDESDQWHPAAQAGRCASGISRHRKARAAARGR